jgi:hypothetical protein
MRNHSLDPVEVSVKSIIADRLVATLDGDSQEPPDPDVLSAGEEIVDSILGGSALFSRSERERGVSASADGIAFLRPAYIAKSRLHDAERHQAALEYFQGLKAAIAELRRGVATEGDVQAVRAFFDALSRVLAEESDSHSYPTTEGHAASRA